MPNDQDQMTMGEISRQLKAIWSLLDGQGKTDKIYGENFAALKGEVSNLTKIIEQYMSQGTPRCAERGQRIGSMEKTMVNLAEKLNGGVGRSRACIEHKDLLQQHERSMASIAADMTTLRDFITKDFPETLNNKLEPMDKQINFVKRWIFAVTVVLVLVGGVVKTFGPTYIENKNKQFRKEIVLVVQEELRKAQRDCLEEYISKYGVPVPNVIPGERYPIGRDGDEK